MSERATSSLFTLPDEGEVTLGRSDQCTLRLDDPLLSRLHATVRRSGDHYEVVDKGSMNGTWVGPQRLAPNTPHPLAIGDNIKLGKTNLVVQFAASGTRPRRVWTHGYFEARLEDECARAEQGGRPFAVARVHAAPKSPMATVEKTLVEILRPVDVLAMYAGEEYEALLVETLPPVAHALAGEIEERLHREGVVAKVGIACYPHDGRTPEALVGRAGAPADASDDASAKGVVTTGALARLEPLVKKVAAGNISVLVLGETGVGKEVLARMIHDQSPRANKPLVCLNCASLSESLLESELFGHEKGAFTGAIAAKQGLLESAAGGTAFLDEVGEMPLSLQAKLLRVIEQREVLRVGALTPRPIDVRFVAATNRDLQREIAHGRFRQDLYFRLNGFSIVIPPLRERTEEIEPLAKHFVAAACKQTGRRQLGIGADAIEALRSYEWPGNIRELKNVIDRAVLLCSGGMIRGEHVAREQMGRMVAPAPSEPPVEPKYGSFQPPLVSSKEDSQRGRVTVPPEAMQTTEEVTIPRSLVPGGPRVPAISPAAGPESERDRIVAALEKCAWNQTQAAKLLGISRQTLVTRLEMYNLPRPRKKV
jgi:DNA-binding NtrC family response regulator